jgi:hypothetical protein
MPDGTSPLTVSLGTTLNLHIFTDGEYHLPT